METDKESSISGIMAADLPLMSSGFTEREVIARHGSYVLVKARRFGKWFTLKALDERYASDGLYRELLRKEFEIGFSLEHPNICRTYDLVNDGELGLCIVQEYVQGVRLDDWLPSASVKARRRAVGQILDAMSCFHAGGIVHRDLKPSNILVTDNGSNVKIIDFGLSDADRYAILKQPAGTIGFSAPQQMGLDSGGSPAAASGYTDVRNDIYSFGRILPLFRLGGVYSRIARKATAANPAKRYADVEEIRSELHRADVLVYALGAFVLVCGFVALAAFTMSYQRKVSRLNEDVARFDDSLSTFNSRVREFEEAKAAFSQTYSEWQKDKERKRVFEEVWEMLKKDADAYYAPVIEHTKSLSPYDLDEDCRWSGSYFEKTPVLTFEQNALDKYAGAYSLDEMSVRQLKVMLDEYCNRISVEHSRLTRERWMALSDR